MYMCTCSLLCYVVYIHDLGVDIKCSGKAQQPYSPTVASSPGFPAFFRIAAEKAGKPEEEASPTVYNTALFHKHTYIHVASP